MTDVKTLLANAKLPERTVPLCLRGDLQAAWEDATRRLDAATQTAAQSLAGADLTGIAAEIAALEQQMADATLTLRVRAVPRRRWGELWIAHPAADDGDPRDKTLGVDTDGFFAALLPESTVEPALDTDDWTQLLDTITDAQYALLTSTVWTLNRQGVDVPFSRAASRILATSGGESTPPAGSAFP